MATYSQAFIGWLAQFHPDRLPAPTNTATVMAMDGLLRQFASFFGVGVIAAVVHYGFLIVLVELSQIGAVIATLVGYVGGGIVSYVLNERHTYSRARSHAAAGWRFALVAAVGFGLTYGLMTLFVERWMIPYLLAQLVTTAIVLVWSFFAHKIFSFGEKRGQTG